MQPCQDATTPSLNASSLNVEIAGCRLVEALSFALAAGDWLAVLGRNGVGKTLTLETLCGLREPSHGHVRLCGQRPGQLAPRELAQRVTLVTQHQHDAFATTVAENAVLGRYPHLGIWQRESEEDYRTAAARLDDVALQHFHERDITTLSGGERQRAAIAQSMVQDTPVLMLDEPLSHLDPSHAGMVVKLLAERAAAGYTLITSLHDINIAARWSTHVLMLHGDGRWQFGKTSEILDAEALSALYGARVLALKQGSETYFVTDPG